MQVCPYGEVAVLCFCCSSHALAPYYKLYELICFEVTASLAPLLGLGLDILFLD